MLSRGCPGVGPASYMVSPNWTDLRPELLEVGWQQNGGLGLSRPCVPELLWCWVSIIDGGPVLDRPPGCASQGQQNGCPLLFLLSGGISGLARCWASIIDGGPTLDHLEIR